MRARRQFLRYSGTVYLKVSMYMKVVGFILYILELDLIATEILLPVKIAKK